MRQVLKRKMLGQGHQTAYCLHEQTPLQAAEL